MSQKAAGGAGCSGTAHRLLHAGVHHRVGITQRGDDFLGLTKRSAARACLIDLYQECALPCWPVIFYLGVHTLQA